MSNISLFNCLSDDSETIPKEVLNNTAVAFPKVHTNSLDISKLSILLKNYRKDNICYIPFCTTVEAEAMGGNINLGDSNLGPRVKDYKYTSLEELITLDEIDLNHGRIKEVLDSIEILKFEGEVPCLKVVGPLTILSSLIDQKIIYKEFKKGNELLFSIIKIMENSIVKYILEGIKKGAKVISYSDPVASIDLVGPKTYKELSGKATINILKRIEPFLVDCILHLCGKISTSLQSTGFIEVQSFNYNNNLTYGEAIYMLIDKSNEVNILGHNCMKKTPFKTKDSVLWKVTIL